MSDFKGFCLFAFMLNTGSANYSFYGSLVDRTISNRIELNRFLFDFCKTIF